MCKRKTRTIGLREFGVADEKERLRRYRRFLYEASALGKKKGKAVKQNVLEREQQKNFKLTRTERFRYKTHYFTDSGIIGSREFVRSTFQHFKGFFQSSHDRKPNHVTGLDGVSSLKQLRE